MGERDALAGGVEVGEEILTRRRRKNSGFLRIDGLSPPITRSWMVAIQPVFSFRRVADRSRHARRCSHIGNKIGKIFGQAEVVVIMRAPAAPFIFGDASPRVCSLFVSSSNAHCRHLIS